jgi:hypothetical protein
MRNKVGRGRGVVSRRRDEEKGGWGIRKEEERGGRGRRMR